MKQHGRNRANFAPYSFSAKSKKRRGGALPSLVPKRGKKRVSWTQKFICLASKDMRRVPGSIGEKEELIEAGLGEKSVFIPDVECSAQEFKETLITEFPKLADAGGFELMRCINHCESTAKKPEGYCGQWAYLHSANSARP